MILTDIKVGDIVERKESSGKVITGIVTRVWGEYVDILRENGFVMTVSKDEAIRYLTIIGNESESLNTA